MFSERLETPRHRSVLQVQRFVRCWDKLNEDATFTATENMTTTIINHADLQAMEKLWASVSQWICFLLDVLVVCVVEASSHCDIMFFSVCIFV